MEVKGRKQKRLLTSFQNDHLSSYLYFCFLQNCLTGPGPSGLLLIWGVMLGKEGVSLQLIPLSLIINSWVSLPLLPTFSAPWISSSSLLGTFPPHSRQIQKRPPISKIIYIFPLSHLSKIMKKFAFFHLYIFSNISTRIWISSLREKESVCHRIHYPSSFPKLLSLWTWQRMVYAY